MRALLAVAFALLLSACARNDYAKFYTPAETQPPPALQRLPYSGEPRVVTSDDLPRDVKSFFEEGYNVIGSSGFIGPMATREAAITQAKNVGAAVVIIKEKYVSTASGSAPIAVPTAQTTYTSGNFNTYGRNSLSGTYSGATTTYGTETVYVPYSVDRHDQTAVFLAPIERKGAGVMIRGLTPAERQDLGTNKGVAIEAIRKGSPAYAIDIVPGDVLLSINGQPVADQPAATALLLGARGSTVTLAMVRKGEKSEKEMSIPAGDW